MQLQPMKGAKPDAKNPIRFPVYASIKYDGIRCWTPAGEPRSNQNKLVPNKHIARMLAETREVHNKDFEIIVGDPADPLCYNRTETMYKRHDEVGDFKVYIFDDIEYPDYSFTDRQNKLRNAVLPDWAVLVKQHLIENQQQLDELYAKVTGEGHEGLILRSPGATYKFGRSTAKEQGMLKLKPQEDSEFRITGCYEAMENLNEAFENELGRTARSSHQENKQGLNMLGGFYAVEYHTGVEFKVAPGKLTHDQRRELWQQWLANPEAVKKLIGKYRHFPVGAKDKPRHGRWIGWTSEDLVTKRTPEEVGT